MAWLIKVLKFPNEIRSAVSDRGKHDFIVMNILQRKTRIYIVREGKNTEEHDSQSWPAPMLQSNMKRSI